MGKRTWKDYEGTIVLESNEDRNRLMDYINRHNTELAKGHVDMAIPMEEEYEAETEEDKADYERTIIVKGSTDISIEDFADNLCDELETSTNIGIEDIDLDFTGYEWN